MKERPILFSAPMVRAILDGSKTQTRRVVKDAQPAGIGLCHWSKTGWAHLRLSGGCSCQPVRCPYGIPGNQLWVRETFNGNAEVGYACRATEPDMNGCPWRPSIFMPRAASRILLRITDVRVQRLQEISNEDARAEGISDGGCLSCGNSEPCGCNDPQPDPRDGFSWLWQSIHGSDGWHANPWVWVITFRRIAL